jgi:hypothetical protein
MRAARQQTEGAQQLDGASRRAVQEKAGHASAQRPPRGAQARLTQAGPELVAPDPGALLCEECGQKGAEGQALY